MVPMKPAADKLLLLLDLVERSLSGELHASGFASASAHLPQAVQLKGGSKPFSRPISDSARHVTPNCPTALRRSRPTRSRIAGASDELSHRRGRTLDEAIFGLLCSLEGVNE